MEHDTRATLAGTIARQAHRSLLSLAVGLGLALGLALALLPVADAAVASPGTVLAALVSLGLGSSAAILLIAGLSLLQRGHDRFAVWTLRAACCATALGCALMLPAWVLATTSLQGSAMDQAVVTYGSGAFQVAKEVGDVGLVLCLGIALCYMTRTWWASIGVTICAPTTAPPAQNPVPLIRNPHSVRLIFPAPNAVSAPLMVQDSSPTPSRFRIRRIPEYARIVH